MENIRLIIWDLDETFWKGTLSEGNIIIPELHIQIIKELTNRGIINSICSKNDKDSVKTILEGQNLWQYFVFPKISWDSKGNAVKEIVSAVKLRPESILFIDDNPTNRGEVKYFIPGINVADPEIISTILDDKHFQGKNDNNHSRLKQYKILEEKQHDEKKFNNNREFLEQSNVHVEIHHNKILDEIERIYELNQRTNQLNFTKKRLSKEDLISMICSKDYETAYISVKDKYGDYGIVGFYALKNQKLEQFYFSCRVLGLGVEQWVYAKINYPFIDISGDIAVNLSKNTCPDWINLNEFDNKTLSKNKETNAHILLIGGCDLEQTAFYLEQTGIKFDTQFNYIVDGKFDCHPDSSLIVRQSCELSDEQKNFILSKCKFYDEKTFLNNFFKNTYDVILYSPIIDMSVGLWHSKEYENLKVIYGNRDSQNYIPENYTDKNKLKEFYSSFIFEGGITQKILYDNLKWIRAHINPMTVLVILNAGENDIKHPQEPERYKIHIKMNKVIEKFCEENNNTYLLNVKKLLKSDNDYTDNIRHYTREIYYSIATMFIELLTSLEIIEPPSQNMNISKSSIDIKIELKKTLRKMGLLDFGYKINNFLLKIKH